MCTRRAAFWVSVWLAIAAVVGGGALAYIDYGNGVGPADAVRGYFAALARGDAPAALADQIRPHGSTALLTSAVLAEQLRLAPIHDIEVAAAVGGGERRTVAVSYRLDFADQAQPVTAQVRVVRTDGRWRVADADATVRLDFEEARDRALVAGRRPPDGPVTIFPGALPVRFDTPLLQLFVNSRAVAPGQHGRLPVSVLLTATGRNAVLNAVVPMLRRCVRGPGSSPTCPLPSSRFVPGTLGGRLLGDPSRTLQLSVRPGRPGTISIGGTVHFRGRYERLSFDNVAGRHAGSLIIPVYAQAFPVAPLRIRFQDVS